MQLLGPLKSCYVFADLSVAVVRIELITKSDAIVRERLIGRNREM